MELMERMEIKDWLQMNAKLQQKKNALRKVLKEKGVLKKGGMNEFDKYRYFSEAQYKELFTSLFADCGLELKFSEVEYGTYKAEGKQPNGRLPRIEFYLFDMDTGFYEVSTITGEGMDKGDKAGYKAYTGALKYYLADTFMVATGDDPEKESPDSPMTPESRTERKATETQINLLMEMCNDQQIGAILATNGIASLNELSFTRAGKYIQDLQRRRAQKAGE